MGRGNSVHKRVFDYAQRDKEELYRDFAITAEGLDSEQEDKSRRLYGENLLAGRVRDTVFYRLRRAFINPFSVILLVLAAISFVTDVLLASNFSRDITTVSIILTMVVISGAVRFIQEMRSKKVADRLTDLIHSSVTVRRGGEWREIPSSRLVVGDTVRLSAGDRVPADIRITEASDLFVSQSVLTGESAVLEKIDTVISGKKPVDYGGYVNIAFMGSAVMGGTGKGVVLAVGQDTVYGGFSGTVTGGKDRFDKGANSIAWVLIRYMAVLIPIVFAACGITKGNWVSALLFALSVAVGLTPEMLPMVINACLAKGSGSMSRKQTVVKNIDAMQGFGSMDVLCVDKTGTLTGDIILLEYYMDILGNESEKVLELAFLNSCYHTGVRNHLDRAILKCREMPGRGRDFALLAAEHRKLDELPFDYERKLASVLVKEDEKNLLIVKGGIREVCGRCGSAEHNGVRLKMDAEGGSSVHAVVDDMLEDGMKVLAVAYKELDGETLSPEDENDLTLLGYLAFFDAPKETAARALSKLKEANVEIRVLTGDEKGIAHSVCARLGINTESMLTGQELEGLTDDERSVRIEKTTLFAELSPKQKSCVVRMLQENGHTVGFLGDGMNDLPAIVQSDVGISVDTASEAVRESSDVILLKKDLNVLEEGITEGRKAFSNMSKYIRITSSSNLGNILSVVAASVFLPFFPMTSVQLLLLNLLYDILCLALPWDNVDKEELSRPSQWSGRTLSRFMRFFGPISSLLDICTFAFMFFVFCPWVCGGSFFSLQGKEEAGYFISLFQTGWFLESMWTQVLILHLLRTKKTPLLESMPSAPVMTVTLLGIFLFTLLTFTPAGGIIGLTPLPAVYFAFLVSAVLMYLLLVTLAKKLYVKKYRELL